MAKNKFAPKRTPHQIEQDDIMVADLFVRNVTLRQIATHINERAAKEGLGYSITYNQVYYDVKKILAKWKDERDELIDHYMELEMAKLDRIEAECWIAWEKSKTGRLKKKFNVELKDGQTNETLAESTTETSSGDVRYLDRIQGCIDKRIDLLGISAPKKIIHANDVENPLTFKDDELVNEIQRLSKVVNLKLEAKRK